MTAGTEAETGVRAVDAEAAGRRVEEILDEFGAAGDARVQASAEELVRTLMRFYGAGLARILCLLDAASTGTGTGSGAVLERLLADEQVAALLTLHDLHPEDLPTRVARALDTLPGRPLELVELDEASGVLRLKPSAADGCGCQSTTASHRAAAEAALACFAPEVSDVQVEGAGDPATPLLQISTRPGSSSPVAAR